MQEYIKVVLADANEEFRTLLQQAVEKAGDFAVVGSCGDGEEALRLAKDRMNEKNVYFVNPSFDK